MPPFITNNRHCIEMIKYYLELTHKMQWPLSTHQFGLRIPRLKMLS
jgi:hypothetical protein